MTIPMTRESLISNDREHQDLVIEEKMIDGLEGVPRLLSVGRLSYKLTAADNNRAAKEEERSTDRRLVFVCLVLFFFLAVLGLAR